MKKYGNLGCPICTVMLIDAKFSFCVRSPAGTTFLLLLGPLWVHFGFTFGPPLRGPESQNIRQWRGLPSSESWTATPSNNTAATSKLPHGNRRGFLNCCKDSGLQDPSKDLSKTLQPPADLEDPSAQDGPNEHGSKSENENESKRENESKSESQNENECEGEIENASESKSDLLLCASCFLFVNYDCGCGTVLFTAHE